MTSKPKRRWFQFSLRGIFILVTFTAVVAARVSYLQRWAAFHEQEAERYAREKDPVTGARAKIMRFVYFDLSSTNRTLSSRFRTAIYYPWTIVDVKPPPNSCVWVQDDDSDPFGPADSHRSPDSHAPASPMPNP